MEGINLTRLERLKNGENFKDIFLEEVKEISNMKEKNSIFDSDFNYFYSVNYFEQIKNAREEKALLKLEHDYIEVHFEVDRIYSYNELFRDSKNHNENYIIYEEEIKKLFKNNDKDGRLSKILNSKYLMIQVEFEVNHRAKDLDNVMKPFLDNLFKCVKNDDNSIKKMTTKLIDSFIFKNEDSNKENIYFRIIVLNEEDIEKSSIKRSIINKKKFDN